MKKLNNSTRPVTVLTLVQNLKFFGKRTFFNAKQHNTASARSKIFVQSVEFLKLKSLALICCLALAFAQVNVQAAIYTSVSNGSWNSTATWDRNGTPDVDNWPNDKVIINHAVTGGNITMNGSTSRITINNGGSLTLTGTLNVGSGQVHVNSGGALTAYRAYLNTSNSCGLNGTITTTNNMDLDGHFTGSPTIVVGGNLLAGAMNKNQIFTSLDLQVTGNMTVNNAIFRWSSGTVTVGGNFQLTGTGDVDVPTGGSLDVSGTLSVSNLLTIDGPSGSGSGGVVSWGVGNVLLSGNNQGLNNCPLPYTSPFDLSSCSQAAGSDVTPPVITLLGNASESLNLGGTYTDAGATATDDTDGNLTGSISTVNNVDVNTVAVYTITYNVSDAAGNAATEVSRTVEVMDVIEPVITLVGNATESVEVGGTYTDAGATASDNYDGDLTGSISTVNGVDVNTAGSYTVTYNVNDASGNSATEVVRTVNVVAATRTSIADGNFNDGSTWDCSCVPSEVENVVIAHDINLNASYAQNADRTFTVNSGKFLIIPAANTLSVAGALVNNGTIDGHLSLNGSSVQTPTLGIVNDLEIDNESAQGVQLQGDLTILGRLVLTDGTLDLNGHSLTMDHDGLSGSLIVQSDCGNAINGPVTMKQYVPESAFGHHYLSSPMSDLTLSSWEDDFSFQLTAGFPHLYYYYEPNSEWVTPEAATDSIIIGLGYTGYFQADKMIDVTGTINCGDISVSLTNEGDGWNFIGNPYPAPLDWTQVTVPSDVSPAIYVWDHIPSIWGRYTTYLDGVGTNGGTNIVPVMQGFFMGTTVNTNIVFQNDDKVTDASVTGSFFRKAASKDPLIRLQASGYGYQTEAVVRFKDEASQGYDERVDALLFPSGDVSGMDFASISSDDQNLVINTVPAEVMNTKIPLYVKIGTAGNYEIEMTGFDHFSSAIEVVLHDEELGVVHDLKDGAYAFTSGLATGKDRFYIETRDLVLGVHDQPEGDGFSVWGTHDQLTLQFETPLTGSKQLEVYNTVGQQVYHQTLEQGGHVFNLTSDALKTNAVYFVKVQDYSGVQKVVTH